MPPKVFVLLGMCGSGNPSAISREIIADWEHEGIIQYLGETSDVRPIIAKSTCIILPSFYKEGIPRTLLEAMAMAKPIITTNVAGCKEVIAPPLQPIAHTSLLMGENGILIPPHNPHALTQAIEYLACHSDICEIMGKKAREIILSRFDMQFVIRIYTQIVARHTKSHQNHLASLDDKPPFSHTNRQNPTHNPTKKDSIAFISNTCFGMYNFRLQVLQTLHNQGFIIHIIAPFDKTTTYLQEYGFICHNLHIDSKSLNPYKEIRTIYQIAQILRKIKPTMLFNYTIKPVIYASFIARILKIKHIDIITGLGYVFIGKSIKKRILRTIVCLMYKIALKNVNEVWFLNPDDRNEFIKRKIISANKSNILPSEGVDTRYFSPDFATTLPHKIPQNKQIQNFLKLTDSQPDTIVFTLIARMLWDKGVGEFVEAARMLKNRNRGGVEVRFYLLGAINATNPSAISREIIANWEYEGIIQYLGEISDVRQIIAKSTCIILPSYREGVPMSLLEAMAMAKPIITTNVAGCKEIIKNPKIFLPNHTKSKLQKGDNGFLCEAKDSYGLFLLLQHFIALSHQERENMGRFSRQIAQSYDTKYIINRYLEALR